MLTRNDQTVEDCLDLVGAVAESGVRHLGFKDVGVPRQTLSQLTRLIKDAGCTSYMEVVSTSPADALNSARIAAEIGVERLLGGTQVEETLAILKGTQVAYHPFPGRPVGHPTKLGGSAADVAADTRRFVAEGCAGVDLLAYRATEADPIELVKAARGAMKGYLIVAGSVNSAQRIRDLAAAGADAFTIGSAVFDGSFSPRKGALHSQLADVLAACR